MIENVQSPPVTGDLVLAGPPIRTGAGGRRLERVLEECCDRNVRRVAVDAGSTVLTWADLDAHANRLARHLLRHGARAGDRIALLIEDPAQTYACAFAVLKIGAAFVPLDPGFPADRLAFIAGDAGVRTVLTLSHLREQAEATGAAVMCLDEAAPAIAAEDGRRLDDGERGRPGDDVCYVIYTSGTTGRPKGVPATHAAVCHFVQVAARLYGMRPGDRVYQGMTIAFDFSVEEIWVPLLAGATLVPRPPGAALLGEELWDFLTERRVTALCCVPTLLATLDRDVPGLRFLLVSGEACPPDLVRRWHRPGRRFLNVYGPTETTVTATWGVLRPDRPVTLGTPLPGYAVVILDPEEERALPRGEVGEIGIAGVGLSPGYLNRDDLTARAFVPDFLGIPGNPSGRLYRSGDLGRVTEDGEIEYLGRIDTQVQIHGYRVEPGEIESVLLEVPGIAQAVVTPYEAQPGVTELVAYYSLRGDAGPVDREEIAAALRTRLPSYMVPAYLEHVPRIPTSPSGKADRGALPPPTGGRGLASPGPYAAPTTERETVLAEALAEVLGLEAVSVDACFFTDLGANSLLMARFCARVRDRVTPPVSMKDVYLHPTIGRLAARSATAEASGASVATPVPPVGALGHALCGAAQLLLFLAYTFTAALVFVRYSLWISAAPDAAGAYLRAVVAGSLILIGMCLVPIAAKWLLVGRWKPGEIRVWSPAYLRFWLVKTLVRLSPMVAFAGSPLYVLYLRALGARIGPGVVVLTTHVPVCADLLTIGGGTVVRKDTYLSCYRARAGLIETGPVTIGRDAFVGEASVIDIGTAIGDGAQLGHSSSLHSGQSVPDGACWHGSPAQPATCDYRLAESAPCGPFRRARFAVTQALVTLVVAAPLTMGLTSLLTRRVAGLGEPGPGGSLWREALTASTALFFGGLVTGLALVVTLPRLLGLLVRPGRTYPLYGPRHWAHHTIGRLTNVRYFTALFGDSSYIVHYLRALGYRLTAVEQTGSNFGMEVRHETPYHAEVGPGTMVSDGLSIIDADYSSTSFRVSRARIGAHTFVGNGVAYPAQSKVGDNCLLATKVLVPIDGPVRHDVGLLGSPPFEIPRTVQRDARFDHMRQGEEFRRRLAAKNRYNLVSMGLFLLVHWFYVFGLTLAAMVTAELYDRIGGLALAAGVTAALVFTVALFVLAERAAGGFRPFTPAFCSIYERTFWRHERFWKFCSPPFLTLLAGTPYRPLALRLLGVRMGRRVFDDGCAVPEKTLVTIGDGCTLGEGCILQAHSLEDGTFKSDHIRIGAGCTVGTGALVHYGVLMGDGAELDADSFLMKGEEVPSSARWRGNPAVQL